MSILCRFRVNVVTPKGWGTEVALAAMYSPEGMEDSPVMEEIRSFYDSTPSGVLTATIKNEAAEEQFQVGDEFYVRLEKIPHEQTLQAIYARKARAAQKELKAQEERSGQA